LYSGPEPDAENAKFGAAKSNNTPHEFIVNGKRMEVYFSPTDNTTAEIERTVRSTQIDAEFSLLVLTRNELADAFIDINNGFFSTVRGTMEQSNGTGSDYQYLLDNGVEVYSHTGVPNILHHKYCIIDQSQPEGDPKVITGSHNWSSTAENVNDENTVIIHDARVANLFYQEWNAQFLALDIHEAGKIIGNIKLYPNPAGAEIQLALSTEQSSGMLRIYAIDGKLVHTENLQGNPQATIDVSALPVGMYNVTVTNTNGRFATRFSKR